MKKLFSLFFICMFANSLIRTFAQETFPVNGVFDDRDRLYAFTNATIVVDYQTTISKGTLLIRKGMIEAVSENVTVPKDAVVMDMNGKFIYPSLIDIYSDYGMQQFKKEWGDGYPQFLSKKKGAYSWNQAIKSEFNANEFFAMDSSKSKGLRAIGFGSVLSHQKDGIARGSGVFVLLDDDRDNKIILKDKASAHYSFKKGSSSQDYPSSEMGAIALLRQTYLDAQWYAKANSPLLQNRNETEYNISLEAWNKTQILPQIFEVDDKLEILRADKVGDEFGVQYIIKGNGDEYQRLDEIKNTKAPLIVSLNFPAAYNVEDPYDALQISLTDMRHWEMAPANCGLLEKSGIAFAITSSDLKNPQQDFWKNLRKAIKYGLSEKEAMKAMTVTPAKLLGMEKQVGSLEKGKIANFLIVSDTIFKDNAIIFQNWVQGKQNILNNFDFKDVRGNYDLSVEGIQNLKLQVGGKPTGLEFKIILDDTTNIKVSGNRDNNLVSLFFNYPKDSSAPVRLSGWINGNIWKGKGQLSNGKWVNWSSKFISAYQEKADTKDKKKKEEKPEWGAITYPFEAFGWKTIPKQEAVLFKNATVWTNEKEGILKNADVLIENGKIAKVGQNISAANAKVIDASGKHVSSGIVDEHSHIAISKGVNEGTQAVSSEVRIGDVINSEDINIYRNLAGGVVAAQLLHGSANPIGGQSGLIKLRWGYVPEKMKIENATERIKFALGENVKQSNWGDRNTTRFPQSRMGVEQVYIDAFTRAKEYEQSWKKYNASTDKSKVVLPRKDLELEALVEILHGTRLISCHSYVQSEINMLIHVADSMGFKVNTFTHILEGYKVADKMKKHGSNASSFSDWWSYKYEVIDAIPYNGSIMNKMGLITAFNSDDAEMSRRLNQEAAKAVKYGGTSEEDALKFVTLNPAKMLRIDDRTGSIKVGKDADVVLWSDNPLSIYAIAEKTFVDGICFYDRAEEMKTREWIQEERNRLIKKMLAAKQNGESTQKEFSKEEKIYHCED